MLTGAIMALKQSDLKRVLAYTTVSSLGIIVFLLGLGTEQTIIAASVYLLSHALFKGALFMTAGIIDHETGSRDIRILSGLGLQMPITAAVAIFAGLSMAGIPPLMGFISKELLYDAVLRNSFYPTFLIIVCLATNIALLAASVVIALRPFIGAKTTLPKAPHDPSIGFLAGPAVLALLGFIFGFFLEFPVKSLIQPMAIAIAGYRLPVDLYLWHGLNLPLLLSIFTIAAGAYLFKERRHFRDSKILSRFFTLGPERGYFAIFKAVVWLAAFQTRKLQSGFMRNYLLIILAFTIALVGYTLFYAISFDKIFEAGFTPLYHEIALAVVVIIGVLAVIKMRSRLGAVAALGVVGYGAALFFVFFGAPDLAMTQFAIETLTVILFVFVLYQLPGFTSFSGSLTRFRDLIVAGGFGTLMMLIVLAITVKPYDPGLSTFFAENSYTLAKGRNVVNVILVDFRALDTLGEILVIAVAAIGVYALLKLRIKAGHEK
jgi:multicomponent Na+:H+ antiporter subunit A